MSGSATSDDPAGLRVIVLAGRNDGAPDPLAQRFGQSHRSLIPLAGQPMIAHVLHTALHHPRTASLAICIEREAFGPVWDVLTSLPGRGSVALIPARACLADSVRDAAKGWEGPLLVITADHALLTAETIDAVAGALTHADVALALSPRAEVERAHRAAKRRFLSFRDGAYAACDIYGAAGPAALHAVDVFGGGAQASPGARIRLALGTLGLLLLRARLLTLPATARMASRHLGLRLAPVVLADGSQALDVDDYRSYAVARDLLDDRQRRLPAVQGSSAQGRADRRRAG